MKHGSDYSDAIARHVENQNLIFQDVILLEVHDQTQIGSNTSILQQKEQEKEKV